MIVRILLMQDIEYQQTKETINLNYLMKNFKKLYLIVVIYAVYQKNSSIGIDRFDNNIDISIQIVEVAVLVVIL